MWIHFVSLTGADLIGHQRSHLLQHCKPANSSTLLLTDSKLHAHQRSVTVQQYLSTKARLFQIQKKVLYGKTPSNFNCDTCPFIGTMSSCVRRSYRDMKLLSAITSTAIFFLLLPTELLYTKVHKIKQSWQILINHVYNVFFKCCAVEHFVLNKSNKNISLCLTFDAGSKHSNLVLNLN